jgi:hypothetical protein
MPSVSEVFCPIFAPFGTHPPLASLAAPFASEGGRILAQSRSQSHGNAALYWQYAERRHGDITVNNNRLIGIALLVVGVILLVMGYNATQAPVEELAESFTGRYSDETMYYLIGGAAAAVIGVVMLLRK